MDGEVADVLGYIVAVNSNVSRAITFTFGLKPLGKV